MERIILYLFAYLTEGYIVFRYASCFFIPRHRTATRLLTLSLLYLVLAFFAIWEISWLNVMLFIILNGIFLFSQYRLSFFQGILHLALLTALMAASEIVVYSIVSRFAPHFYTNPRSNFAMVLFGIFSKLLFFLAAYLLMLAAGKKMLQQNPSDRSALWLRFLSY